MKLSMMSYTLSRQLQDKDKFDIVAMCRLSQELHIEAVDMVSTYRRDSRDIRKILDDHGLKIACYTFSTDINHATATERAPAVDHFKKELDNAVVLGADKIMFVTPYKANTPRDVSRRNFIHGLQEASVLCRLANITLSIENFPGCMSPFVVSSDILEAIREVPGLKLTFDNGNAFSGGEDPAVSFERCKEHVIHAHFKDWEVAPHGQGMECMNGAWYGRGLIGEGIINHASCLQAMAKAGYKGYINIEYEGDKYPSDQAVRKAAAYLRSIIPTL